LLFSIIKTSFKFFLLETG